ncbi:hypothetical protein Slin15195_G117320 [Septoria linicola]|uniref:Uncharacterized protein n=1 Tax=Septoria linicola TaxID=215465 RepID=A0A9Q9ERC2_9PEZI|nr:hypothetical protein Slin14017_G094330 [Septoria linicola]USW58413.1 hypothetical protein Slin15195_G117320 [Septoria linicola]
MACMDITRGSNDNYWRFRLSGYKSKSQWAAEFRDSGYHCPSTDDVLDVALLKFSSRPNYMNVVDKHQLRKFVTDRKLMKNPNGLRQSSADKSPTFEKVAELPAELRVRIYGFYLSYLPETLHRPTQPPLARLNKMMRDKVLTEFYKTIRFEIHFNLIKPRRGSSQCRISMDTGAMVFLLNMRSEDVAIVRHLQICLIGKQGEGRRARSFQWARINVDLADYERPARVDDATKCTDYALYLHAEDHWWNDKQPYQHKVVEDIVEVAEKRLGPVKQYQLKVADLMRLVTPIENVLTATAEKYKPADW